MHCNIKPVRFCRLDQHRPILYNGKDVPQAVRDFDPDAVILDIALSDMSGYELARRIRKDSGNGGPLLIGISGRYKQGSDKILAGLVGFDHYLVKPFDPQDLLALLAPLTLPSDDR